MKHCIICNTTESKYWAKGKCGSCYHKDHYQKNLSEEREKRRISGKAYYNTPRGRFTFSKNIAKHRNHQWTLQLEEYILLISKKCEYCDSKLNPMGVGLDRIDSNLGYVSNNVVPCCGNCNVMKNDILSYDEMKIAMKAVLEFRRNNVHK